LTALVDTYMEKTGDGARPLSHLSVRECESGFAVEEVVGEIDTSGERRGTIVTIASGLSRAEAESRYREAVEERHRQGFVPARP